MGRTPEDREPNGVGYQGSGLRSAGKTITGPNSSRIPKARSDSRKLVKQSLPGFSGIVC